MPGKEGWWGFFLDFGVKVSDLLSFIEGFLLRGVLVPLGFRLLASSMLIFPEPKAVLTSLTPGVLPLLEARLVGELFGLLEEGETVVVFVDSDLEEDFLSDFVFLSSSFAFLALSLSLALAVFPIDLDIRARPAPPLPVALLTPDIMLLIAFSSALIV